MIHETEVESEVEMTQVTIRLPRNRARQAKIYAAKRDVTLNALWLAAIEAYLPVEELESSNVA